MGSVKEVGVVRCCSVLMEESKVPSPKVRYPLATLIFSKIRANLARTLTKSGPHE